MGGSDRKIDRFHMPTLVLPNKIDPPPCQESRSTSKSSIIGRFDDRSRNGEEDGNGLSDFMKGCVPSLPVCS